MSKEQSADDKTSAAESCLPVKMDKKVFVFGVEFDIGEFGDGFGDVPLSRNDCSTI